MLAPRFQREILAFLLERKDLDQTCLHVFLAARCLGDARQRAELSQVSSEVRRQVEKLTQFDLNYLYDSWDEEWRVRRIRTKAVELVAAVWTAEDPTKAWLTARVQSDESEAVRQAAVGAPARGWKDDPGTLPLLKALLQSDESEWVRQAALVHPGGGRPRAATGAQATTRLAIAGGSGFQGGPFRTRR